MINGAVSILLLILIISTAFAGAGDKRIQFQLKKTGKTNSEVLQLLDYVNNLEREQKPSYLQIKFPANSYPFSADPVYPRDTDKTVHAMMRDIVENGFTAVLSIGSNRQEFYCIFDTGSSVMFVNSFEGNARHCNMNAQYDSSQSNTYKDLDQTISLIYGGGFLMGDEARDSVWLHDIEIKDQTIAMVTGEDDGSTINFSGLVGLSYPNLAPNHELLFFDNIMRQNLLESNVFTVYYFPDGEHADITFGYVDSNFYTGEITYAPVQEKMHWNIPIDDVKINGESLGFGEHSGQGLVDTGTNLNTFEDEQMSIIFRYIRHSGRGDTIEEMPTLTYTINGVDFDLEPEEYYVQDEDNPNIGSPGMFGMDVFQDKHHPSMVIGVVFMQKYFTIFDRDNDRVGFALANTYLTVNGVTEADRIQTNAD